MEYVYAIMLLNEADKELNEENITRVLEAADVEVNSSRVKAAVASLEDLAVDDVVTEMTEETMDDVEAQPADTDDEEEADGELESGEDDAEPLGSADDPSELPESEDDN